jgi:hypothetical protein
MRPDTIDSHRLIRWSASTGKQNDIVERLFAAYFEQGRDIGDTNVLKEIAAEAGMDADLVGDLLAGDDDRETIEHEDMLAHRMGISGVPTFIFENKYMISGAHDSNKILRVIDKVVEGGGVTDSGHSQKEQDCTRSSRSRGKKDSLRRHAEKGRTRRSFLARIRARVLFLKCFSVISAASFFPSGRRPRLRRVGDDPVAAVALAR